MKVTMSDSVGKEARGGGGGSLGSRHSPLNSLLAREIRDAIVTGRYRPGERLVEGRLAEDFGVSRIPVREALRSLASEGYVTLEPRKGATVAMLSRESAIEMIEIRATLEGLNARLATRRRNPDLIARLQAVLAEGSAAAAGGETARLAALNSRYHELLAEAGMNRILAEMMRQLRERTAAFFGSAPSIVVRRWQDHAGIVQAIIDGDEDLAAALAARHVSESGRSHLDALGA
jgi:DNA-binding GntR family transcriptional regulator